MKKNTLILILSILTACGGEFGINSELTTTDLQVYDSNNRVLGKYLNINGQDVIQLKNGISHVRVDLSTGKILNGLINESPGTSFCYYASTDCSGHCLINGTSIGFFAFSGMIPGKFHAQGYYSTENVTLTAQSKFNDETMSCEAESLASTFRKINEWDYIIIFIEKEIISTHFDPPLTIK